MLVRWNERPTPSRQRSWGAVPVTSRPRSTTSPASGRRCPVIRLKRVVLPAPLGPMMALMEPRGTLKLTPLTAWKPAKLLASPRTSSMARPPIEPAPQGADGAGDPPGKDEEQKHEDDTEDERPE